MPSRFQIREAVVKFLYSADLEGSGESVACREPLWEVITESDRLSVQDAMFWTVQQLANERKRFIAEFTEREAVAKKLISAWSRAKTLKDNLKQIAGLESEWIASFSSIFEKKSQRSESVSTVKITDDDFDKLLRLDRNLAEARRQFLKDLESYPTLRRQLEMVVQKIGQNVAEADERHHQIEQLASNEAGVEIRSETLLTAWQLYRSRRKRRTPRATAGKLLSDWPEELESLESDLERISKLESEWSVSLTKFEREMENEDDVPEEAFSATLAALFKLDREIRAARNHFLRTTKEFPVLRGQLEPVESTIRRLQLISDVLQMAQEAEKFPEERVFARILASQKRVKKLRREADSLIDLVLAKKAQIDATLAAVFENFSAERIDPVDHSILRLGTYEILYAATPAKVAINEGIQLAKRFGTTDSGRFVNGVLDRIAKQAAEHSESQDVL